MNNHSQPAYRLVMFVTIGAAFMSSLDLFVVNVAFGEVGADLGVGSPDGPSAADLSWVLNAYAVLCAAFLVPFGRIADRYGRKRMFLAGLVVFALASTACALSTGVWTLVAARAMQAVGASAMTPSSLGLLMSAVPPERRVGAIRLWAASGALAAAIGPTLGGLLTQISWHWVFLINLPISIVFIWVAARSLSEARAAEDVARPDLAGAVLFAVAVGLLALGLVKTHDWGWSDSRTIAAFGGSLTLAAAFAGQSRRHASPVIPLQLLGIRSFRVANMSMLLFNMAFGMSLLVGILWLQQIWAYSALTTGYAISAGPAVAFAASVLVPRLAPRGTQAGLAALGSIIGACGTALMAMSLGADADYVGGYVPGWLLVGVSIGMVLPNVMAGATRDLGPQQTSTGSGIATMSRQVGFVLGISAMFAIVGNERGLDARDGFTSALWVAALVMTLSAVSALGMMEPKVVAVEGSAA